MKSYLYVVNHLPNSSLAFEHEYQLKIYKDMRYHEIDRAIALRRAHTAWCEIVRRAGGL